MHACTVLVVITYIIIIIHFVGATPISNAQYFGQGFGPVNIQSTACSGNEVNILSCTYMSPSHCYHSDDSGVRCTGKYEMVECPCIN